MPTAAEVGLPEFHVTGWTGYLAPAGTPVDVINLLHAEITAVLRSKEFIAWIENFGSESVASTPKEFAAAIRSELIRWRKIVEDSGVSPE